MIIVEKVLGNAKRDLLWQQRIAQHAPDVLALSQWEAQKSRCRKTTRDGLDLGISLARDQLLSDGDVLLWDEAQGLAVVVHIHLRQVAVIDLRALENQTREQALAISFELGHALGNQHWKAVIKQQRVFVPLVVDEAVLAAVLKSHGFQTLPCRIVPGESVLPELTHAEARLLFGGAEDAAAHVHVGHHPHDHHAHTATQE